MGKDTYGGAWCPKDVIEPGVREWIEIDLHRVGDDALDVGHHADGGQHHLGFDFLLFVAGDEVHFYGVLADAEVLTLGAGEDGDALFFEGFL